MVCGRLARLGEDWLLLVGRSAEWIVRHDGVVTLDRALPAGHSEDTWSVVDRLTPPRACCAGSRAPARACLVHFVDDQQVEGRVGRVGRDFFELDVGEGRIGAVQVVPVAPVAALQGRRD